jgi:hypothetical protein
MSKTLQSLGNDALIIVLSIRQNMDRDRDPQEDPEAPETIHQNVVAALHATFSRLKNRLRHTVPDGEDGRLFLFALGWAVAETYHNLRDPLTTSFHHTLPIRDRPEL